MTQTKAAIKIGTHVRIVGNTQNAGRVGIVVSPRKWGMHSDGPTGWDVEVPSGEFFAELVSETNANLQPLRLQLVSRATCEPIEPGATVRDSDGEEMELVGFTPGRSLASTGRICVKESDGGQREFYPSVIDAEIREAN
jgi:hypothetical protein